ncbi:hypothetical protein OOT00_12170 [Desulfobotulus sp. H1]|uniref:Flagellar assembly protein T N-terminal domain-containing protein n=1 Tax=Desulfobotulus pelophilus TaxID=2823377 RepID=A0ABT3NBA0_9BACT|nr:hypothetical protein [Desulfobotulus pelophilus]MCW7754737.1 hypothetical protein [Desulfobotulus pelophilus]
MVKKIWYVWCVLLLAGPQISWVQAGGGQSFLVMGTAEIQGEGGRNARSRAEQVALSRAVERFVLESLPESRIASSLTMLDPLWEEKPDGYIREFRILGTVQEGNRYHLVARVLPDGEKLTRRMKELGLGFSSLPGVLFMVSEQGLMDDAPRKWWVPDASISRTGGRTMEAMVTVMGQAGFHVILPDNRPLFSFEAEAPSVLDTREARRMGALFGAPVVLVGRARVEPGGNVMGDSKQSFRASVLLVALHTETGDVLAETEDFLVVVNENPSAGERDALYEAGRRAAARISPELQAAWSRKAGEDSLVREIRMDIGGDSFLTRFAHFRRALNEVEGVISIERREITAQGMDVRVRYRGRGNDLATALMGLSYDRFGVRISDVEEDRMRVTLVASP